MSFDYDPIRSGLAHRDLTYALWHIQNGIRHVEITEFRQQLALILLSECVYSFPFDYSAQVRSISKLVEKTDHSTVPSMPLLTSIVRLICRSPISPLPQQFATCFDPNLLPSCQSDPVLNSYFVKLYHHPQPSSVILQTTFNGLQLYLDDPPQIGMEMNKILEQLNQKQTLGIGGCLSLYHRSRSFLWQGHVRHGSRDPILALWDAWVYQQTRLFVHDAIRFWRKVYLMLNDNFNQQYALIQGLLTVFHAEHLDDATVPTNTVLLAPAWRTDSRKRKGNNGHKTITAPILHEAPLPSSGRFRNLLVANICRRLQWLKGDPMSMLLQVALSEDEPRLNSMCLASPYSKVANNSDPSPMLPQLLQGWSLLKLNCLNNDQPILSLGYVLPSNKAEQKLAIAKMQVMDTFRSIMSMPRALSLTLEDPKTQTMYWAVPFHDDTQYGTATLGRFNRKTALVEGIVSGLMMNPDTRLEYLHQCCFRAIMGCGRSNDPARILLPSFIMLDDPHSLCFEQNIEDFTLGRRAMTYECAQLLLEDLGCGRFNHSFEMLEGLSQMSLSEMGKLFQQSGFEESQVSQVVLTQIQLRSRLIGVLTYTALRQWDPHS
jgi:hypothetical protein